MVSGIHVSLYDGTTMQGESNESNFINYRIIGATIHLWLVYYHSLSKLQNMHMIINGLTKLVSGFYIPI